MITLLFAMKSLAPIDSSSPGNPPLSAQQKFYAELTRIQGELESIGNKLKEIEAELQKIGEKLKEIGEKLEALQKKLAESDSSSPLPTYKSEDLLPSTDSDKNWYAQDFSQKPTNVKPTGMSSGKSNEALFVNFINYVSPDKTTISMKFFPGSFVNEGLREEAKKRFFNSLIKNLSEADTARLTNLTISIPGYGDEFFKKNKEPMLDRLKLLTNLKQLKTLHLTGLEDTAVEITKVVNFMQDSIQILDLNEAGFGHHGDDVSPEGYCEGFAEAVKEKLPNLKSLFFNYLSLLNHL